MCRENGSHVLRQRRPPRVPLRRVLVGVRNAEHRRFGEMVATDLKTDRQARCGESARNGNRRQAIDVERGRIDQATETSARRRSDTSRRWWRDERSNAPLGRRDEDIDGGEDVLDLSTYHIELPPRLGVGGR